MPFSARNARYLRISAHMVLLLYIYLDDKHIEWMSDYILQRVLADLKPLIGPKLHREGNMYGASRGPANAKKGTVDVERGDTYQFAYFFRRNEPHAVLIKSRNFVPTPVAPTSAPVPAEDPRAKDQHPVAKKRKRHTESKRVHGKVARLRGQQSATGSENDVTIEDLQPGDTPFEGQTHRGSRRKQSLVTESYKGADVQEEEDVEMLQSEDDSYDYTSGDQDCDIETPSQVHEQVHYADIQVPSLGIQNSQEFDGGTDEEQKPKMTLQLSYQGFTIHDQCLCVVIEPWNPLQDSSRAPPSRAPSLALTEMRLASVAPEDENRHASMPLRERTPLFLPDPDSRRSLTPMPLPSRILPPVPLFNDLMEPLDEGEEDEEGMMAFSQALRSAGNERAGSADEDEDGDVFLGDADERRGGS